MSTSPSWFDKQKFSALVKQVGPKRPAETMAREKKQAIEPPAAPLPAPPKRPTAEPPLRAEPAPTANDPAPIIPPEAAPIDPPPQENSPVDKQETSVALTEARPREPEVALAPPRSESAKVPNVSAELDEARATIAQLTQERQVGRGEVSILRGQMEQMEEAVKDRETLAMQLLEALQTLEERKEQQAAHEANHGELRAAHEALQKKHGELQAVQTELQTRLDEIQVKRAELQAKSTEFQHRTDELQERCNDLQRRYDELQRRNNDLQLRHDELTARCDDLQLRRDEQVAALKEAQEEAARLHANEETATRKQESLLALNQELIDSNENLQGQMFRLMQESARLIEIPQLEEESHRLRETLQRREAELFDLRQTQSGNLEIIDSLKFEVNRLNEEVAAVREQSEAAQQGLSASQKTLQETREALREASQNSANRAMLENLQRECSTLVQQNMLLQAQLDQLQRELSAAKAKAAAAARS